jgi:hypothetical protein
LSGPSCLIDGITHKFLPHQVQHTAFDAAASNTSLAADGSFSYQASSTNAAAVTLLWRLSEVERFKLVECTPSLAQILLGECWILMNLCPY